MKHDNCSKKLRSVLFRIGLFAILMISGFNDGFSQPWIKYIENVGVDVVEADNGDLLLLNTLPSEFANILRVDQEGDEVWSISIPSSGPSLKYLIKSSAGHFTTIVADSILIGQDTLQGINIVKFNNSGEIISTST